MNRRDTISALLGLGAATGSFGVRPQSMSTTQNRALGVLTLTSAQDAQDAKRGWFDGFRAALKSLGWVEGHNMVIESAFADYKAEQLPALAEKLVRNRVDVIWTFPTDAAIAAGATYIVVGRPVTAAADPADAAASIVAEIEQAS